MIRLFSFIFILVPICVNAQIGTLEWRNHFSAYNAIGIAETSTEVFMASSNGIVEYDTEDNTVSTLTVTNGLSDLGISAIASNQSTVIVGYANGNLDVIETNSITNIPWIKSAEISGNKSINAFFFDENQVYVACNIGLVLLDLDNMEIKDTYYPFDDPEINDVTIFQDTLFCATEDGIYYAYKDAPFLNDKNQWSKRSDLPAGIVDGDISEIEGFGDKLVFVYNSSTFESDSIYYLQNNVLNAYSDNPKEIFDLHLDNGLLLVSTFGGMEIIDAAMSPSDVIFQVEGSFPIVQGALFKDDEYWLADTKHGMVKAINSWSNESVYSNTPYADGCYRIDIQYGNVLVAGGGLTHNLQNNYFRNGVYKFENETWTNFNADTQDSIDNNTSWDFISVAVNPNNTDEFAFSSSSEGGLMIVRDGERVSEVYDQNNSPIEFFVNKVVISDMKYDSDGNLWIINQGVEPLKMLTPEGVWHTFEMGSAPKNVHPYRLLIDRNDNKWVGFNQVGLAVFNENGTYDDTSDDELQLLTSSEGYGNLPTLFPKAYAEDVDGEIWIGTDLGLVVLYNTGQIFEGGFGDYDANPILLEVDGEVEKLLGESDITAIAIDGGNRKWIGTSSSGVFCLSPDGTEEVYRYTKENSPLLSNNIFDIRMDYLSGEVYIATESGLVSVRTDATLGDPEFSDVTVFPNPVRPNYSGPITIQGLGYESDVKITDVSGNVVYKTTSNGGTVIWNGQTLQGERAKSGVYLVWAASIDGRGREVAKILMIN